MSKRHREAASGDDERGRRPLQRHPASGPTFEFVAIDTPIAFMQLLKDQDTVSLTFESSGNISLCSMLCENTIYLKCTLQQYDDAKMSPASCDTARGSRPAGSRSSARILSKTLHPPSDDIRVFVHPKLLLHTLQVAAQSKPVRVHMIPQDETLCVHAFDARHQTLVTGHLHFLTDADVADVDIPPYPTHDSVRMVASVLSQQLFSTKEDTTVHFDPSNAKVQFIVEDAIASLSKFVYIPAHEWGTADTDHLQMRDFRMKFTFSVLQVVKRALKLFGSGFVRLLLHDTLPLQIDGHLADSCSHVQMWIGRKVDEDDDDETDAL